MIVYLISCDRNDRVSVVPESSVLWTVRLVDPPETGIEVSPNVSVELVLTFPNVLWLCFHDDVHVRVPELLALVVLYSIEEASDPHVYVSVTPDVNNTLLLLGD